MSKDKHQQQREGRNGTHNPQAAILTFTSAMFPRSVFARMSIAAPLGR